MFPFRNQLKKNGQGAASIVILMRIQRIVLNRIPIYYIYIVVEITLITYHIISYHILISTEISESEVQFGGG